MQHSSCSQGAGEIRSLKEVPTDSIVEKRLLHMCRLAWEGAINQQLTFSNDVVHGDTLGLMFRVRKNDMFAYKFLHPVLRSFFQPTTSHSYHLNYKSQSFKNLIRWNTFME